MREKREGGRKEGKGRERERAMSMVHSFQTNIL